MCRENDAKLREYFGRRTTNSVCADELRLLDASDSEFDAQIITDSMPRNEHVEHQKMRPDVVISDDVDGMQLDQIILDVLDNVECEQSDRPINKYGLVT